MYIWKFDIITKWTFHDEGDDGDAETFTVASNTFDLAWQKIKKIALTKKRKFVDDQYENEKPKTHFPVSTEVVGVKRLDWIDG